MLEKLQLIFAFFSPILNIISRIFKGTTHRDHKFFILPIMIISVMINVGIGIFIINNMIQTGKQQKELSMLESRLKSRFNDYFNLKVTEKDKNDNSIPTDESSFNKYIARCQKRPNLNCNYSTPAPTFLKVDVGINVVMISPIARENNKLKYFYELDYSCNRQVTDRRVIFGQVEFQNINNEYFFEYSTDPMC